MNDEFLFSLGVDDDDLQQEAELFRLEKGTEPSYLLLRKRLGREAAMVPLFSFEDLDHLELVGGYPISLRAVDMVSDWVGHQPSYIQDKVFDYLEDPTEEVLKELLDTLGLKMPKVPKRRSYAEMVFDSLPASLNELVLELGPRIQSKRPAATIRQSLRRMMTDRKIDLIEGVYVENEVS